MASSTRVPNAGQLVPSLPGVTAHLTGHDASTGETTFASSRPGTWTSYDGKGMAFNTVYTTSEFPASLNNDIDIANHEKVLASQKLGLVNPNGTVLRMVDFAPGFESMMHRTQSLDYGIVLEGTIELGLDSGEKRTMQRGDIAVQRGTNHAWRNPHETEWCRMVFVLQDCQKVEVNGVSLKEDLGRSAGELPSSGNDR